ERRLRPRLTRPPLRGGGARTRPHPVPRLTIRSEPMPPSTPANTGTAAPFLFPRPRHIHGFDPRRFFDHRLVEQIDAGLPTEGFAIDIDRHAAVLRHRDEAGL